MKILLSGATGFIGKDLLQELQREHTVHTISRGGQGTYKGDLSLWLGGLPVEKISQEKYDVFVHAAGLYDLRADSTDLHLANVTALSTALALCQKSKITRFVNLSSIAAGINSPVGICKPYDLYLEKAFPDYYAESKAQGEKVLINFPEGPELRLNLRLGAIVGDTLGNRIQRIDGPYHAPFAMRKAKFLIEKIPTALYLPGSEDSFLPIVPVDVIAKAIKNFVEYIVSQQRESYESYNLTPKVGLSLGTLYRDSLKKQAIANRGIKLSGLIPDVVTQKISSWIVDFPEQELAYVFKLPKYNSETTSDVLGDRWCPEYFEYEEAFWSGYEKHISNS
ncbi:MAG: SDR family oxidoreductase [Bdellovibrionia bacterium]